MIESLKRKLTEKYDDVNTIDGVRVDFRDGWVLIRASNTEAIIRLSVEADSGKRLDEIESEFRNHLEAEIAS